MNPIGSRYPGRFIVIGKDGGAYVVIYGAMGRSPGSLARKFVQEESGLYMTAVDKTVSTKGNPELLEYPAVKFFPRGVVVANGKQIENITELQTRDARKQLSYLLSEEACEPDEYRTPRITGCLIESESKMDGALHIARSAADGIDHSSWSVEFEEGKGAYIATYRGEDVKPTPSFSGNPLTVSLNFSSANKAAKTIFGAFVPPKGGIDYRVGVVAVYKQLGERPEVATVNRIV